MAQRRAAVLQVNGRETIVLTPEGDFLTVPTPKPVPPIGAEIPIVFPERSLRWPWLVGMVSSVAAAVLAVAIWPQLSPPTPATEPRTERAVEETDKAEGTELRLLAVDSLPEESPLPVDPHSPVSAAAVTMAEPPLFADVAPTEEDKVNVLSFAQGNPLTVEGAVNRSPDEPFDALWADPPMEARAHTASVVPSDPMSPPNRISMLAATPASDEGGEIEEANTVSPPEFVPVPSDGANWEASASDPADTVRAFVFGTHSVPDVPHTLECMTEGDGKAIYLLRIASPDDDSGIIEYRIVLEQGEMWRVVGAQYRFWPATTR